MADLAGDVRRAVKQLAVDDQPTANAGADRNSNDVRAATRSALPPLTHGRAVRVVVERRGKIQSLGDTVAQLYATPAYLSSIGDPKLPYDLRNATFISIDTTPNAPMFISAYVIA